MVFLTFRVFNSLLQQLQNFSIRTFFKTNISEIVTEITNILRNIKNFLLKFILLFIGQLAQISLVLFEHVGSGIAFADDLSEEQFVEAKYVKAGHL